MSSWGRELEVLALAESLSVIDSGVLVQCVQDPGWFIDRGIEHGDGAADGLLAMATAMAMTVAMKYVHCPSAST
jgi:hypothetical protein